MLGNNTYGQLGQGNNLSLGNSPNQMGNNLNAINLGSGLTAVAVGAGRYHSCALISNGSVKCWGGNSYGQLGQGDTRQRGDGLHEEQSEMGDNLPAIDLGSDLTAVAIELGNNFVCALLNNGSVKCWGRNNRGQLGQGDTRNRGDGLHQEQSEMGNNLSAISLGSDLTVRQIAPGGEHTCALLNNGDIKCWGNNARGQLGKGNTTNLGDSSNEMGSSLAAISLGDDFVIDALEEDESDEE